MKDIIRRALDTRLPHPVVGCAMQADRFLAMAVSGAPGLWRIHWCLSGTLGNKDRVAQLRELVGSSPFWTVPRKQGATQRDFAFAVDVPEGFARSERERVDILRTQASTRFSNVAEEIETGGVDVQGPDGRHLVGFGTIKSVVEDDFRFWRRECGVRRPHIASSAAAIANLYLQLCEVPQPSESRMLIVEGDTTTTAVVIKGWRLVDAVEYQMVAGQPLDRILIEGWIDYRDLFSFHQPAGAPPPRNLIPCQLSSTTPGLREPGIRSRPPVPQSPILLP